MPWICPTYPSVGEVVHTAPRFHLLLVGSLLKVFHVLAGTLLFHCVGDRHSRALNVGDLADHVARATRGLGHGLCAARAISVSSQLQRGLKEFPSRKWEIRHNIVFDMDSHVVWTKGYK